MVVFMDTNCAGDRKVFEAESSYWISNKQTIYYKPTSRYVESFCLLTLELYFEESYVIDDYLISIDVLINW